MTRHGSRIRTAPGRRAAALGFLTVAALNHACGSAGSWEHWNDVAEGGAGTDGGGSDDAADAAGGEDSDSGGGSEGSSGGSCVPSSCTTCVIGQASCTQAGACQCCVGGACLPD
jgi:hypothetical protein